MRKVLMFLFVLPCAVSGAKEPASPYASLEYLVGSCWQGTLPGGRDVDTHCFSWIYGRQFMRDTHAVHGAGREDYLGESIYFWNSVESKLQYLYIESAGSSTLGSVEASGDTLLFPDATSQKNGRTLVYRSHWHKAGADAYDVITEFKKNDGWAPGFSAHMKRVSKVL